MHARLAAISIVAIIASAGAAKAADAVTANPTVSYTVNAPAKFRSFQKLPLELLPKKLGCWRHAAGSWQAVPCLSKEESGHLAVPVPTGSVGLWDSINSKLQPVSNGEIDIHMARFGRVSDPQNGGDNEFGIQLNTNYFRGSDKNLHWVQFTYVSENNSSSGGQVQDLCIWQFVHPNLPPPYQYQLQCIPVPVDRGPATNDTVQFSTSASHGFLSVEVYLPWASGETDWHYDPGTYALSVPDLYGLEGGSNWHSINGGLVGAGGGSTATFTRSCLTTSFTMNWSGLGSGQNLYNSGGVDAGPSSHAGGQGTGEKNNLAYVNTPMNGLIVQDGSNEQGPVYAGEATFDEVSQDWTSQGQKTCYPQTIPPPNPVLSNNDTSPVFEDDGTSISLMDTSVHVCANDALMIGIDASRNRFLCSNTLPTSTPASLIADNSTFATVNAGGQSYLVHVCPGTSAMVGWNQQNNWLICGASIPDGYLEMPGYGKVTGDGPPGTQVPEPRHPTMTMHACDPKGSGGALAMQGINVPDNVLVCINSGVEPAPPK